MIITDKDLKEQVKQAHICSYRNILKSIEIIKDSAPDMYKSLSWYSEELEEVLNVEQMTEYCNKRIKELEVESNEVSESE